MIGYNTNRNWINLVGSRYLVMFSRCLFLIIALNEALKKEVEGLKIATGEATTPTNTFNLGMHHIPYTQSSFLPPQPQHMQIDTQNIQMPPFQPLQSNTLTTNPSMVGAMNSNAFTNMMQQDPLGQLQGLDISSGGSHSVKSEGPSISTSESSGTLWY